jgi:hypothetical protein
MIAVVEAKRHLSKGEPGTRQRGGTTSQPRVRLAEIFDGLHAARWGHLLLLDFSRPDSGSVASYLLTASCPFARTKRRKINSVAWPGAIKC